MEEENTMTCDGCERLTYMDIEWGVSTCNKTSITLCATCIRKRLNLKKPWAGAVPRSGERSLYTR